VTLDLGHTPFTLLLLYLSFILSSLSLSLSRFLMHSNHFVLLLSRIYSSRTIPIIGLSGSSRIIAPEDFRSIVHATYISHLYHITCRCQAFAFFIHNMFWLSQLLDWNYQSRRCISEVRKAFVCDSRCRHGFVHGKVRSRDIFSPKARYFFRHFILFLMNLLHRYERIFTTAQAPPWKWPWHQGRHSPCGMHP
jgi:hypothetical protein